MAIQLGQQELEDLQLKAQLKSLPRTGRGIVLRAKSEKWESSVVPGKGGPRGLKTLYTLPEYVLKELEELGLMHLLDASNYETTDDSKEQNITLIEDVVYQQPITKSKPKPKKHQNEHNEDDYVQWASKQNYEDIVPIRYCKNVWASAGHGIFPYDETTDVIWFRKSFIKNYLGVRPANCVCIRVHGDSMHPTIKADGTVLIEMGIAYKGEGIYLIRQGNELKIKRLQSLTSEIMRIISDNKEMYPPQDLDISTLPEDEFAILGRYLWDAGIAK